MASLKKTVEAIGAAVEALTMVRADKSITAPLGDLRQVLLHLSDSDWKALSHGGTKNSLGPKQARSRGGSAADTVLAEIRSWASKDMKVQSLSAEAQDYLVRHPEFSELISTPTSELYACLRDKGDRLSTNELKMIMSLLFGVDKPGVRGKSALTELLVNMAYQRNYTRSIDSGFRRPGKL